MTPSKPFDMHNFLNAPMPMMRCNVYGLTNFGTKTKTKQKSDHILQGHLYVPVPI